MKSIHLLIFALLLLCLEGVSFGATDCNEIEATNKSRQCHAIMRGLPKNSSWDQISLHDGLILLQQAADFMDVEPEEIFFIDPAVVESKANAIAQARQEERERELKRVAAEKIAAGLEEFRLNRVKELGLRTEASWEEIESASSERSRQRQSAELGLRASASWQEIADARERQTINRLKQLGIDLNPWWRK